jgi:hypothetical protein
MSWLGLQVRRARWLAQDVRLCLRELARLRASARGADQPIAIALVQGDTHAIVGRESSYRIRIANDSPDALDASLEVCGERPDAARFAARVDCAVAARASREVFLRTDWVERFEIVEPPAPEVVLAAPMPEDAGTCRVVVTLETRGRLLDRQAIVQPLVG